QPFKHRSGPRLSDDFGVRLVLQQRGESRGRLPVLVSVTRTALTAIVIHPPAPTRDLNARVSLTLDPQRSPVPTAETRVTARDSQPATPTARVHEARKALQRARRHLEV